MTPEEHIPCLESSYGLGFL